MFRKLAQKMIATTGFRVVRNQPNLSHKNNYFVYSEKSNIKKDIVDLAKIALIAETIPGMITPLSGQLIYALCSFQKEEGDVVEIGSWQGRSASFLARSTFESKNGQFYAIDHFKGNPGKEHYYIVGKEDLSDLKDGFVNNIERVGLSHATHLLDMPNEEAAEKLADKKIRFLFIDGDHSGPGVQKDIELFFPMLIDGAIVVFDDYSNRFPGLLEVIDQQLQKGQYYHCMAYPNSFVLKYKKI
jgi:predicted O-methyltransferase YrrM